MPSGGYCTPGSAPIPLPVNRKNVATTERRRERRREFQFVLFRNCLLPISFLPVISFYQNSAASIIFGIIGIFGHFHFPSGSIWPFTVWPVTVLISIGRVRRLTFVAISLALRGPGAGCPATTDLVAIVVPRKQSGQNETILKRLTARAGGAENYDHSTGIAKAKA